MVGTWESQDINPVKKLTCRRQDSTRKRVNPHPSRWVDVVEWDLLVLDLRGWQMLALNKECWDIVPAFTLGGKQCPNNWKISRLYIENFNIEKYSLTSVDCLFSFQFLYQIKTHGHLQHSSWTHVDYLYASPTFRKQKKKLSD